MSAPAAFKATYSDLKFIKSRKVAQILLELPIEQASGFVEIFGTPNPASEIWVGIARLANVENIAKHQEKRRFENLKEAMQAGIRCNEPAFWRYIREEHNVPWVDSEGTAADFVRKICGVTSRSALNLDPKAAARWQELDAGYMLWLREPQHA